MRKILSGVSILIGLSMISGLNAKDQNDVLTITPENTIIINAFSNGGPYLQYFLSKCMGDFKDVEKLNPLGKSRIDRSKTFQFPMFKGNAKTALPKDKIIIAVGRTRFLTKEELTKLGKVKGSFMVKRKGNVIVLAGSPGSFSGQLSAVRWFLNHCVGIRIYAPDSIWWSRVAKREFTIGDVDYFQRPYLKKATWSGAGMKRNALWTKINIPCSGGESYRASHTITKYFNSNKYYKKHPEIYEMKANGKRVKPQGRIWQPCFSAKKLSKIAMEEIRGIMKKKPNIRYLSFGIMDISCACHCPDCVKSVKGIGHYGNLYFSFLNKVAQQCQKEFPGLYLTAYAYNNVGIPVNLQIEPNIIVDCANKRYMGYNWVNPAIMQETKNYYEKWNNVKANWMIHDWGFSGVTPREYSRQYANFLQWGVYHGMKGLYVEWSPGEPWYLDGPKYWIMRQLMSNPFQDVDAMWVRYCRDMYGDAGELMFQFFRRFSDKFLFSDDYIMRNDLPRQEMLMFNMEDIAFQEKLLNKSIELTKNDELIQERFKELSRYWKGHKLFVEACSTPGRLQNVFIREGGTGINKKALAYYVNEKKSKIKEALDYYQTKRTIAPDSNEMARKLSLPPSYVNNYTRAKGDILSKIRTEALKQCGKLNSVDDVNKVVKICEKILRANLPAKYDPAKVEEFLDIFRKTLFIPKEKKMPVFDGDLSDKEWSNAAKLEAFSERDTLAKPNHATVGKIMRVGDKLVVGLICRQNGDIWARTTPDIHTGSHIWRESGVEFFFGPPAKNGKRAVFAQYIVNALGAFRGFRKALDNRNGVEVAVKLDRKNNLYTIEAAFPLKTDRYDFTTDNALTFNIMRNVYVSNSYSAKRLIGWYPIFYTAGREESRGIIVLEK